MKSRFRRVVSAFTPILFALVAPEAHATDGYFLNGTGAKAKGEAGVAIALPQDALSIAANPAAAVDLGHRLDLGVDVFIPDRHATISGSGPLAGSYSGNGANPFILPEIGYVRPLSDTVSVGIAISGNGGMNTVYKTNPFATLGATGPAGVDLKQIFVAPTLAVRAIPGHSLGISPLLVVQGFRATGIQPFAAFGFSSDAAHFSNLGTSWAAGGGVRIGYLGHFGDALSLGAFYQSKIRSGKFGKYAGLFADQGGFDVPASWGVGAALKATPALTLAGDFKRILYSDVPSVGNPIGLLFANKLFGSSGGPGFGWRDISVFKLGASYRESERLTVRAGYGRSQNPVPVSQTLLNILAPGVVQDHITAGATWTTPGGHEITGYVLHALKHTVNGSGSLPPAFGPGDVTISLAETSVGLAYGVKW